MNWSSKWGETPIKSNRWAVEAGNLVAEVKGWDLASATDRTILIFIDGQKRRSIDVIIVGDLALDYDDDGWNIYHVPTLARFTKAVPTFVYHGLNCP